MIKLMNSKNIKISVLDWSTVSTGDISQDEIFSPGEINFYPLTSPEKTAERIGDSDIVLCNKVLITEDIMEKCKNLRYIGLFATGYNNIDIPAAKKHNITVCNAGGYSTDAVAQHTFALILDHYSKVSLYKSDVSDGKWITSPTFSMFPHSIYELAGKTIAIIGYGCIGKAVAKIADAFNMNVIVSTRTTPKDCPYKVVSIDEAFSLADIVTLHCPLTAQTEKLVNKDRLSMMKSSSLLINTSRGPVVDEYALAEALKNNVIAGAALDVLEREPMHNSSPLLGLDNCTITPHVAWAPLETRKRLISIVNSNIKAYISGSPTNVIV